MKIFFGETLLEPVNTFNYFHNCAQFPINSLFPSPLYIHYGIFRPKLRNSLRMGISRHKLCAAPNFSKI